MNTNVYANRKRKKPQKSVKPTPLEGAKSNPSKRHRDRLNGELERLANLLPFPQDVISRLDKLTVLRLCVSYLRAKSFFNVTLKSSNTKDPEGNVLAKVGPELPEGELLLQVLNGFVLVVTAGGTVFYASSTIQDYLGFHQSDVIHQSVYDLIHTEDRAEFQRQLHWALKPTLPPDTQQMVAELLPPENSAFLERNFVCRFRCLLDNFSGFIALNFQGRLKFLNGQNERASDDKPTPPQLALFALASPLQSPSILEIRTKNVVFRTKHLLDFTPTDCDAKGRIVLGYTEAELCSRGSGYQFIHAADMLHCAEYHIRMVKTGESGMIAFRLLTKRTGWVWVQANARLIYKNGRPDCVIVSQKVLTNEEGEENLRKRNLELPFCFTTGEAMLYNSAFPTAAAAPDAGQAKPLDPSSLLGCLMKQDESIYSCSAPSQSTPPQDPAPAAPTTAPAPPPPEDESGGIFSSCGWQEVVHHALPGGALFRRELPAAGDNGGGGDADLWSFMTDMGISREDLELFRQDEVFLNVDLGGGGGVPDFTGEILSYVHESLSKWPDAAFSYGARFGDHDQPSPPAAAEQTAPAVPRWLRPQPQPLAAGHAQSGDPPRQPPGRYQQQQRPYAQQQPLAPTRTPPARRRELPSPDGPAAWAANRSHGARRPPPAPPQQPCHGPKHKQVNGGGYPQNQPSFPPAFYLDGAAAAFSGPSAPSSYVPAGLQSQGAGGGLSARGLEGLQGSLGPDGRPPWGAEEARSTYPPHLTYPQSTGPGPAPLSHPGAAGGPEQMFLTQFQNHNHGVLQETGPESSKAGDCGLPGQPKRQAESWPYPDHSLRRFM